MNPPVTNQSGRLPITFMALSCFRTWLVGFRQDEANPVRTMQIARLVDCLNRKLRTLVEEEIKRHGFR